LISRFQVSPGTNKVTFASLRSAQTPTNRAMVTKQFLFQKELKGEEITMLDWEAQAQLWSQKINLVLK